jgi:quercetin dioxygenase-like cupin family protein
MKSLGTGLILSAFLLGPALAESDGAAKPSASDHSFVLPSQMKWEPVPPMLPPGAEVTVVRGNPMGSEGDFVMRLKAPAGYYIAPHSHLTDENLTMISGSMLYGFGEKSDKASATDMPAGTYIFLPKGHVHEVWAGPEGFVIELLAANPFDITYVNPNDDPRQAEAKAK